MRKLRTRGLFAAVLALCVAGVCGCQTVAYYCQAIHGHCEIIWREKPIDKVLADPNTPNDLKEKLRLVQRLRAFAESDLNLRADGHYREYADVHRKYIVWNVEAAPQYSMQPKTWWYPFVGSLEYRGYFSENSAREYAKKLEGRGFDIFVGGVPAYSTLGWFKDPVLNTFISDSEPNLAETIFHELGHQRVFARGDTDFNEAFATTVGQEGARRWLKAKADESGCEAYRAQLRRDEEFARLIMKTRAQLEALYGDERLEDGKIKPVKRKASESNESLREAKSKIFSDIQREYADLKIQWGGHSDYDDWFAGNVNNARINSVVAYYDLVPGFERLLERNDGDLEKFYAGAAKLAKKGRKERQQELRTLAAEMQRSGASERAGQ